MKIDKETIRRRALALVAEGNQHIASDLAREFGMSRQAANMHLQALLRAAVVEAEGSTRRRRYRLRTQTDATRSYPRDGLREDIVWQEVFAPVLADLPENVRDIWRYGVTEMVNNAIDHSGSGQVHVGVRRNSVYTEGWVADDGEGIFLKIQRAFNLYDPREAILELAKGKLTTDPDHHTGEGIFFTSKVFDTFEILSGRLHFRQSQGTPAMLTEHLIVSVGGKPVFPHMTDVRLRLANDSPRTTKEVFDEFAAPEEYTFARTIVPVRLAQYEGEKLVSRSQAKRLSMRFERFRNVVLDFAGVAEIGRAFADELFRVFTVAHPAVELAPINMTPAVAQMVTRAQAGAAGK